MTDSSKEFPKLKVMIVDDHKLFRGGVKSALETIDFVKEVIEASSGNEALQILKRKKIDIIFMDITMNDGNGFETTAVVTEEYPEIGVIALSMHEDEENIRKMIDAGALGYLFKNTDQKELTDAMISVHDRKYFFTPQSSEALFQKVKSHKPKKTKAFEDVVLTNRELDILILICKEFTNKEITETLFISDATINSHRSNLLKKTNSKNMAGLVRFAIRTGIFSEEEK